MNSDYRKVEFFNTCVYGLVSMLEDSVSKKYGYASRDSRYLLWSGREDSFDFKGDCIYLRCGDMYMKFGITYGELIPSDIEGFDYSDIKRITAVVEDCVANISQFNKPISRVEGVLSHSLKGINIIKSKYEIGAYDVVLF